MIGNFKLGSRSGLIGQIRATTLLASGIFVSLFACECAQAEDAKTYGEAFSTPVFERIDSNGVDLLSGMLRISGPVMESGSEFRKERVGLVWTGRVWSHVDRPSIWRKDSVYTVSYNGISEEFKDRSNNYAQKKPITGSSIGCSIHEPGNLMSECVYIGRNGDMLHFFGLTSNLVSPPANYGQSVSAYGNLGVSGVRLYSEDQGVRIWGVTGCGAYCFGESSYYANTFTLTLGNQKLVITTPNHGSNKDEHYLRPKGTIQTITDDNGTVWRYTINGDREMTLVDLPGDANDVAFSYDSNHRVTAVDTADGRWTYSYTTPGDYGTTTVINPLGETTYVRYNRDKGYITEHRNALNQTTYYYYDSGERLTQVTYPEGNAVNFQYDERGNILTRTDVPKQGSATITQTAFYGTGCPNRKTCNRPQYIIDGNGNRTDFEYGPVGTVDEPGYGLIKWPIPSGNSRPKTVRFPAAQAGGIRPETRNEYFAWLLTKTSICQTTANCQGTADEVVTTYNFNGTEGTTRLLFEKTVAWNGQTLRTCYSYDDQGRRVSETPPLANLSSCPSNIVASPAANAVAPVAAFARTTPTYPDSTPPPIPPAAAPIAEPAPPACGPGTGVLCQ